MAEKLKKVTKMVTLIALYLLLTIDTVKGYMAYSGLERTPDPGENYQFTTDILDDHNAIIVKPQSIDKFQFISIIVLGYGRGSKNSIACLLPYQPIKDMGILPLRRLSNKTVLLSAYENGKSGDLKLILVDTENCKHEYVYEGVFPEKRMIFTSKNSSDQRFTVITSGEKYCQGYKVCRLFFNPFYEKIEPLNFNFESHDLLYIEPVNSFDGNLFVVRVWHPATNVFTMRLYDLSQNSVDSPNYKDLITLPNWMNITAALGKIFSMGLRNLIGWGYTPFGYEMKSSGLSVCWCHDREGNETIHCSVFQEDGSLKFNQTLVYPEPMFPLRVENIPNGLVLFSLKTNRFSKREWRTLQVAVITSNIDENISDSCSTTKENQLVKIKHRKYEVQCHYIVGWKVKIDETDGSIIVEYMCYDEKATNNHFLYIN